MDTAEQQNRAHRIALVKSQYSGEEVEVIETDHWVGFSATQISAMKRKGGLPEHYTYDIVRRREGEN